MSEGSGSSEPKRAAFSVPKAVAGGDDTDLASVELSARRTGMSFQRTRLSAERTLMSVIRTSLALISFGFTIFQVFQKFYEDKLILSARAPRRFGEALVYLGVAMVLIGIVYHLQFMYGLRRERQAMAKEGLIHAQSHFPGSYTLVVALMLLALGIAAITSIEFRVGPFW